MTFSAKSVDHNVADTEILWIERAVSTGGARDMCPIKIGDLPWFKETPHGEYRRLSSGFVAFFVFARAGGRINVLIWCIDGPYWAESRCF